MKELVRIVRPFGRISGEVSLPVSKSLYNRIIMLNAYCGELDNDVDMADSGDTALLKRLLGVIKENKDSEQVILDCENAGTVCRFLMSFLAARNGHWFLTGSSRMKERPVEPLVSALRLLGADISYCEKEGFLPVRIRGTKLQSATLKVDTSVSSQFVSSLLMLAPTLEKGLIIEMQGDCVSESYVSMTLSMLKNAGIKVALKDNVIHVSGGSPDVVDLQKEPDWSGAAFWYCLVALSARGDIFLKGLNNPSVSLQGDSIVADLFRSLGVSSEVMSDGVRIRKRFHVPGITRLRFNLQSTPDLVLPIATAVSGLGYGALISGISHLQYKESDRIRALITELRALNINVDYIDKILAIHPSTVTVFRPVNTYNDHRMAMAFAPLVMPSRTLDIRNPEVVSKSYPQFWDMLKQMGFELQWK